MCLLDEHTAFIFRVNELVAVMELPANQEANQGSEKYKFSSRWLLQHQQWLLMYHWSFCHTEMHKQFVVSL